jgi:hypothetical protein
VPDDVAQGLELFEVAAGQSRLELVERVRQDGVDLLVRRQRVLEAVRARVAFVISGCCISAGVSFLRVAPFLDLTAPGTVVRATAGRR